MPSGHSVRPVKWQRVLDLYDDGEYSAIWGSYDGNPERSLGVRWNGDDNQGYPNQGSNPLWFVEPEFTTKMILLELCSRVNSDSKLGNMKNVLVALNESQ